ncbi:monosaccharide ABC transporter membrane protein, CUT2 family [Actinacidiphila yanglinensis]|uniref:Monosaccharide ABC transporter membrane protein, CUT2 family n=1 Tax=Actinacidiphila yanglinensis TaxID=310779 RepID=A0A1H5SWB5_9ACTN|nr:ABC transporter permease [Actinacidiphila yanglinensis]SEF54912.1 monosaccharide ABC transporter membrane protein, CUT2 family [Actinacidiphila yanglinensis]
MSALDVRADLAAPTRGRRPSLLTWTARSTTAGPLAALVLAVVVFSLTTDTFLTLDNGSLVVEQVLVTGTLAMGQTLVILTAGIDLANAMIMVLGTLVMARLAGGGGLPGLLALLVGAALCAALGAVSGTLVTRLKLPPFIVTLGLLSVLTAVSQLYADGESFAVTSSTLTALGHRSYLFGRIEVTTGMAVLAVMVAGLWFALTQTAWGRNVRAVGDDAEATRLTGVNTRRTVLSVYVIAGLVYAVGAWQALGRIPNADPNAFQTGNLDSITAVVIGGTSLFGGRGGVPGTILGTLVVTVLANGLTQAGIDSLYQQVATGVLVIAAVAVDRLVRGRAV